MQKTLGGDRLGSGKKMKVNLHNYQRSTHDLGYIFRSSMSAGTLVPFMSEVALPGDTWDIDLTCDVKTHPTVGPLFGSFKIQLDIFECPIRLYQSGLHNNLLGVGLNMAEVQLPQIELEANVLTNTYQDFNGSQINPSCLLAYLGIRGVGYMASGSENRLFNAIPFLAYWEIYKNYYANKQEEIGMYITAPTASPQTIVSIDIDGSSTLPESPAEGDISFGNGDTMVITYSATTPPDLTQIIIKTTDGNQQAINMGDWMDDGISTITLVGNGAPTTLINWAYAEVSGTIAISEFDLSHIDDMRTNILASLWSNQFIITQAAETPYNETLQGRDTANPNAQYSQDGLALKTYQSDLFNNWLQTEWIDGMGGINTITAIDTSSGSFEINTLLMARKVFDLLNRVAVSGGSYDDWIDAAWGHEKYSQCESPMYMGGLSKELTFAQVVSLSEAGQQPLGTLGGRGQISQKHKGGNIVIKVDEPCYIIGIVSLTPRIDYSQGNKWDMHLLTMDDLHKPGLDEIGFQELITEQMAWWDTHWDTTSSTFLQNSAGKQPAWINYMTNYNRNYGNFALLENEMFMTLNRRYEPDETVHIQDLTTYIDPTKYNYIFAQTSLDAQNFWTQIAVDAKVRRKMSAKIMPNL